MYWFGILGCGCLACLDVKRQRVAVWSRENLSRHGAGGLDDKLPIATYERQVRPRTVPVHRIADCRLEISESKTQRRSKRAATNMRQGGTLSHDEPADLKARGSRQPLPGVRGGTRPAPPLVAYFNVASAPAWATS